MSKYKYLLFDADNTVLDFTLAEEEAIRGTHVSFKIPFDDAIHIELYRDVNHTIWQEFERGEIRPDELKPERFRRYLDILQKNGAGGDVPGHVPIDQLSPAALSDRYLELLSGSAHYMPWAEETLSSLKENYRLGLVTNGLTNVQKPRFSKAGIDTYFEAVVISEEFGSAKPDPEIFEHICGLLGASDKKEIIMIGDNLSSDIAGGRGYGIDTCWYNPLEALPDSHSPQPTYTINDLQELPPLLERA